MLSAESELFSADEIIQQRRGTGQWEMLRQIGIDWQERNRAIAFRKQRLSGLRNHNNVGRFPQVGKYNSGKQELNSSKTNQRLKVSSSPSNGGGGQQ